jgi:hypothetical protein
LVTADETAAAMSALGQHFAVPSRCPLERKSGELIGSCLK